MLSEPEDLRLFTRLHQDQEEQLRPDPVLFELDQSVFDCCRLLIFGALLFVIVPADQELKERQEASRRQSGNDRDDYS